MSGRGAAYRVAVKNARRNRKRTIFLMLLVAVPVGFGVVVAGMVRASTFTPEEQAQGNFGNADAKIHMYAPAPGMRQWVDETIAEVAPDVTLTPIRQASFSIQDGEWIRVWDLDMSDPTTTGLLVRVAGDLPERPDQVALSPFLFRTLGVSVGEVVEFEELALGPLTVVGTVSEPFHFAGNLVLLAPGALEPWFADPQSGLGEPTLLLSGAGAEEGAMTLWNLWYNGAQLEYWPEPAVDRLPPELAFLERDPVTRRLLTESHVAQLVELVSNTEPGSGEMTESVVYDAAWLMIYGGGGRTGLPDIHVETRTQWLNNRFGLAESPGFLSTAAAAIVLVEVAFITGAAFAAGTRRRLREIGLMGANGASNQHIKSTVVGEGLTIGLVGAGVGVVLGIGVMILGRPLLQRFVTRVITGTGVALTDIFGPVLVAVVAVVLAVLIPARTASKVPTTTALQGRMPALAPRKWIIPVGIGFAALGALLVSVSLLSTSGTASVMVGIGATAIVGGVAMLSSPILAGAARLSDRVPATARLVLRDSGRNRTRSAVAVSAIMVILLAPVIAMVVSATTAEQQLAFGLPSPRNHVVLSGAYEGVNFGGESNPITEADVAVLAALVPKRDVAVFDTFDLFVTSGQLLDIRASEGGSHVISPQLTDGYGVAVANDDLIRVLSHSGVAASIGAGEIVVLGIEDRATRVEIGGVIYPAQEHAVAVVQGGMTRVLVPERMRTDFAEVATRPVALFVLERPLIQEESRAMWSSGLAVNGGHAYLEPATIYLLTAAATLVVVLIVVALVTAVSAAEVDHEVRTIVAVGAPGSIRRRFLGLLTGYQTLVAMALAVPLGLGLVKVFNSANDYVYSGPFGLVDSGRIVVPWAWIGSFAIILPIVIGLLTLVSVRSAPVTPPRRAT